MLHMTSLRLQLSCTNCDMPTVQPPRPPRAAPQGGARSGSWNMTPKEEPNQAEAVRPQGYRVGSVLTSRDPAHPENAPNGYLHHRLHVCPHSRQDRAMKLAQSSSLSMQGAGISNSKDGLLVDDIKWSIRSALRGRRSRFMSCLIRAVKPSETAS